MAVDSASPLDIDSAINFDTNGKIDIESAINFDTNGKIDIDSAINTAVGIAVPAIIDTNPSKAEVDIAGSIVIDTAPPRTTDLTLAAIIVDPTSGMAGAASTMTGGFDMAFGLFNFHVDSDGVTELISVSDSTPPVAEIGTPPAVGRNPSTIVLLAPSEEEPRLKTSTPLVRLNDFEEPPPSPATAYCVDCDAYHYVGTGDFSSHDIAGYEDPRGRHCSCLPDDI
jgi:hypothetical protein